MSITINMTIAKQIAHEARRDARNTAFAPLDIKATIPAEAKQAEAQRAVIRSNDDELQKSIDKVVNADDLKNLMLKKGLINSD